MSSRNAVSEQSNSIERQLRRREAPIPLSGIEEVVYGVRELFFEDITYIYDQICELEQHALEEHIKNIHEIAEMMKGEVVEKTRTLESTEIIRIYNEEFEFDSIDQVSQLNRVGFSEFYIEGIDPPVTFEALDGIVTLRIRDDSDLAWAVSENIAARVKRRQNKVYALFQNHFVKHGPILLVMILIFLFLYAQWEEGARRPGEFAWKGPLLGLITGGSLIWYIRRFEQYTVVPGYERDWRKSFWESPALPVLIMAVSAAIGLLAWLYPQTR